MTKLSEDQLSAISASMSAYFHSYFLDKIYMDALNDPSFTGFADYVNEGLVGDGEDPLPDNLDWKDLVVKNFEIEVEVGYRD